MKWVVNLTMSVEAGSVKNLINYTIEALERIQETGSIEGIHSISQVDGEAVLEVDPEMALGRPPFFG